MITINLNDYYNNCNNVSIDVSEEIYEVLKSSDKAENANRSKVRYYKAYFSFDAGNCIEKDIIIPNVTPEDLVVQGFNNVQLQKAISDLPDKQLKRIYAYYFLKMSMTDIAKTEGVNKSQITRSIQKGLKNLKKKIKKK